MLKYAECVSCGEFIVEKQTGRQTNRQIDRQTDKYIHDEKYLENVMMSVYSIYEILKTTHHELF